MRTTPPARPRPRKPATPEATDNRLVLAGRVTRAIETRTSPGGIPISRFGLEHRSRQMEAGNEREAYCRIMVVVAGKALQPRLAGLNAGDYVKVEGFISRSSYRSEASHLVVHALRLERLDQHLD